MSNRFEATAMTLLPLTLFQIGLGDNGKTELEAKRMMSSTLDMRKSCRLLNHLLLLMLQKPSKPQK